MKNSRDKKKSSQARWNIPISVVFVGMAMAMVIISAVSSTAIFVRLYSDVMKQNAITSSEQTIVQVRNMMDNYINDIEETMGLLMDNLDTPGEDEFMQSLVEMKKDVVAISTYDVEGRLLQSWSNGMELKPRRWGSLSYMKYAGESSGLNISKPHVESLFKDSYPWVVTIYEYIKDGEGNLRQVALDIRFSGIAAYIDNVGIGEHGYCYVATMDGNIVYHPQQQLIYSGVKEEKERTETRGTKVGAEAIYTVQTLSDCNWKVVGVCYVDEMITARVSSVVRKLVSMLLAVLLMTFLLGWGFSGLFSNPAKRLAKAMHEFEKNAENFEYIPVVGTAEIATLSDSFGHMVVKIQKLMEKVRQEEISLRKTELKALQAQINPHFLYNTLDAIAWLCEDGKNQEATEMVTSLARLFRISISKGHELILIEKELEHARSYLKIEQIRYKDQFTYDFDVEKECLSYLCNKITLQPIIENAIYHGLNRMVDEGEIHIRIFRRDSDIIFEVEDNGVGMTEERCREILSTEPNDRMGIGIKNVNDRLRIYFGEEYHLTIRSEVDVGTCVTIRMPMIDKEASYEK